MTNWKEEARQELARRAIGENSRRDSLIAQQIEQEGQRVIEQQRITAVATERLRQTDSLGIPGKLLDINASVWENLGELKIPIDKNTPTEIERLFFLEVDNSCVKDVEEDMEPVTKRTFGEHRVGTRYQRDGSGSDAGGYDVGVYERGWYNKVVGHRISGWKYKGSPLGRGIKIAYHSRPDSEEATIAVQNDFGILNIPQEAQTEKWRIQRCYIGGLSSLITTVYGQVYGPSNGGLQITLPAQDLDSLQMRGVVDDLLKQSCADTLPLIPKWIEHKNIVSQQVIDIQSRIGQLVK